MKINLFTFLDKRVDNQHHRDRASALFPRTPGTHGSTPSASGANRDWEERHYKQFPLLPP